MECTLYLHSDLSLLVLLLVFAILSVLCPPGTDSFVEGAASESGGVLCGILYGTPLLYLEPTGLLLLVPNFFGSVPAFLLGITPLAAIRHFVQ